MPIRAYICKVMRVCVCVWCVLVDVLLCGLARNELGPPNESRPHSDPQPRVLLLKERERERDEMGGAHYYLQIKASSVCVCEWRGG